MKWVLTNIRCIGDPRKLNMASSIVSSAANELGSLVVGEVKYLYEVSDKIEHLQRDLLWMRCFLENADNIEHQEKVVRMWVSEMRDFAYEAQEIIERYVHQVAHHRRSGKCNTVKWFLCCLCDAQPLHDAGSRIDGLRSRISELICNLQWYGVEMTKQQGRSEYNLAMRLEGRRTYSHTKQRPIGLDKHVADVVDYLVNKNEIRVVGLWGIGGLGKTTLAREVFKNGVVQKHFENNCVWIYISKQFKRKNIFKEILLGLTISTQGEKGRSSIKELKEDEGEKGRSSLKELKEDEGQNGRSRIKELTEDALPGEIKKVLKDKKCLVVLDDMWEDFDWDILQPAFELINESSSKILITTRKMSLVRHAHGHPHSVNTLDEKDSWKLFQRILSLEEESSGQEEATSSCGRANMNSKSREGQGEAPTVGRDQTDQTKLERNKEITSSHDTTNNKTTSKDGQGNEVHDKKKLAMDMLKHCNGLPLAIRTLGGVLLNKKTISEWQTVQKNISYYLMNNMEHESDSDGLYAVLESSYNDLPYYLKPCFLYMGMFPEDHEIEAENLFHLWEAEGLVTSSLDGGDELQDVLLDDIAETYLNQLVERSMVQVEKTWPNGRIKSCRLHDIMRDMCLKKCREGNFLHIMEHDRSTKSSNQVVRACPLNRRMRRCAFYGSANSDSLVDPSLSKSTPCIRSLLVFPNGNEQPRKVLSRNMRKFFSLLRVLYLPDADIPLFPTVLGDFIHLRFLCLRGTYFFDLPRRIWDCKYLETLDLKGCYIRSLSNKFKKLERLRHLYLPCFHARKGSRELALTISQLRQMETYQCFNLKKCRIEDLLEMTKLRNFSICGQVSKKDLEVLLMSPVITSKRLVNPLSVVIGAAVINEDPSILAQMISRNIHISNLEIHGRIEVPLEGSIDANVHHNLVEVKLYHSEIGKEGVSILGKLPLLEYLLLFGMAIRVNKMSFSNGSFQSLGSLLLLKMKNLEEWEVGDDALPNLRFLRIWECGALKLIPEGLPKSVQVQCHPCIQGIEKYGTCDRYNATPEPDPSKTSLKEYVADFVDPLKYHFYSCQRSICLM